MCFRLFIGIPVRRRGRQSFVGALVQLTCCKSFFWKLVNWPLHISVQFLPNKRLETHNNVAKSPTASTSSPGFHHTQRRYRFSPQDTTVCFHSRSQTGPAANMSNTCEIMGVLRWVCVGGKGGVYAGIQRWPQFVVGCRRLDSNLLQMRPAIVRHLIYSSLRISFYEAGVFVCVCVLVCFALNFNLTCLDAAVPHPLFITKWVTHRNP